MFTLAKPKPAQPPLQFENNAVRQRVLLAGMDCLPDQLDLFDVEEGARNGGDYRHEPIPPEAKLTRQAAPDRDGLITFEFDLEPVAEEVATA